MLASVVIPVVAFRVSPTFENSGTQRAIPEPLEVHTYFYHQDHLGSAAITTDENGQIVELVDYDPFGVNTIYQKPQGDVYTGKYFYTGQEWDTWTRLYYYGARYYFNEVGSFYSVDPAGFWLGNEGLLRQKTGMGLAGFLSDPQGLNSYSYVKNNPVRYVDPSGEAAEMALPTLKWSWTTGLTIAVSDSPLPGPADVIGGIVIVGGTLAAGGMVVHDLVEDVSNLVNNDPYITLPVEGSVNVESIPVSEIELANYYLYQEHSHPGAGGVALPEPLIYPEYQEVEWNNILEARWETGPKSGSQTEAEKREGLRNKQKRENYKENPPKSNKQKKKELKQKRKEKENNE